MMREVIDIFRYHKNEDEVKNYLRWLCDDVGFDYNRYSNLASTMLTYVFNDVVDNDINRTWDAVANREDFEYEYDVVLDLHNNDSAGILEVLVVLARRAAGIMYDANDEDKTEYYFDIMMRNLGLYKYDDDHYDHHKVSNILHIFNNRMYDKYGHGSIFVVDNPPGDMKEVEIWSQMNWYLTEKYFEKG